MRKVNNNKELKNNPFHMIRKPQKTCQRRADGRHVYPRRHDGRKEIRLILDPKLHKSLPRKVSPVLQGIVNIHRSLSFDGSFLCISWLHFWVRKIVENSLTHFLLVKTYFMNLEWFEFCWMTPIQGMLMWKCFKISINLPNCCSYLPFLILWGNDGGGIYRINSLCVLISCTSVGTFVVERNTRCNFPLYKSGLNKSTFFVTIMGGYGSSYGVTSYDASIGFLPRYSWFTYFLLGPSYFLPLLKEITLQVSWFFVQEVVVGVSVDLGKTPLVLKLSVPKL